MWPQEQRPVPESAIRRPVRLPEHFDRPKHWRRPPSTPDRQVPCRESTRGLFQGPQPCGGPRASLAHHQEILPTRPLQIVKLRMVQPQALERVLHLQPSWPPVETLQSPRQRLRTDR